MLVRWCRASRSHRNILMAKQRNRDMFDRNLTKLYLVYLEWEPCDVILDKNHIMLFLVIVPVAYLFIMLSLLSVYSCHVIFTFFYDESH